MAIELINLKKNYSVGAPGSLTRGAKLLKAVDDVTFMIREGETVALIGESGCGKTTIAKIILRLETATDGTLRFYGKDLNLFSKTELIEYRRLVQAVFQNPYASFNPRMRVGDAIAEPIIVNYKISRKEAQNRVVEVLRQVGLREDSVHLYPHEFSGGQRQRLAIARAVGSRPRFVVLDEPVSALDVSIRAQIMNLLKRLQEELGVGYLLIAHDLGTATHLSHRVEIIYSGKVMESVRASELFHSALHPYTKALLDAASLKQLRELGDKLIVSGEPPDPLNPPAGCRFHPRCFKRMPKCSLDEPQLRNVADEHMVRCHLY